MLTGQKIQQLRQNANMTQNELAEKIFVSRDLVSKWENGERRPTYDRLVDISEIFSCEIDELTDKNQTLENELASCFPEGFVSKESNIEEILNRFLCGLPERECNVFIRRYYFLEASSQIASLYGIGDGSVRMILSRTRKKLKKFITEVNYNEK